MPDRPPDPLVIGSMDLGRFRIDDLPLSACVRPASLPLCPTKETRWSVKVRGTRAVGLRLRKCLDIPDCGMQFRGTKAKWSSLRSHIAGTDGSVF